ncbi:Snf7-domain-containing protein [Clohesyomyces aquaticus]|uniref:Snf7-domain-containing protein n=1 Tax=Clohesyomyces aquaticus TaxID=1231657 RepID=A0A1Y2A2L8_9PLEO|nr:Snf7-domain-containing protein [Clohesyomyces aquaticus]
MSKRKRSDDDEGGPSAQKPKAIRTVYQQQRSVRRVLHIPWKPPKEPNMDPLLEFIITHEEAFKSRGRLASLYSDFRTQIETNPDGYHANINAWKKALADATRAGVVPAQGSGCDLLNIRTGDELARALQHKEFGRPMCLKAVFHDAVTKKQMIPLRDFKDAKTSIYSTSWVPSPWGILRWGLRQLGVLGEPGFGDKLEVGSFVVLQNLEAASDAILKKMSAHTSSVDLIMSRSEFQHQFADVLNQTAPLSHNDLDTIFTHLSRDKSAISHDGQTIKFKPANATTPEPISQEDIAIANLRDTLKRVKAHIESLTEEVAKNDVAAREAVKSKQMIRAKASLRSKKTAESALLKRMDIVHQLEGIFIQLQQAADHVEIVEAMRSSAIALKGLNKKVGGAEGVADVVETLQEEMVTADEISTIINEPGQAVDETEVDEEFEALEKAEQEKKEQEEAAKTAASLAELEQAEKESAERKRLADKAAKKAEEEVAKKKEAEAEKEKEEEVEQVRRSFTGLSTDMDASKPAQENEERLEERVPVSA